MIHQLLFFVLTNCRDGNRYGMEAWLCPACHPSTETPSSARSLVGTYPPGCVAQLSCPTRRETVCSALPSSFERHHLPRHRGYGIGRRPISLQEFADSAGSSEPIPGFGALCNGSKDGTTLQSTWRRTLIRAGRSWFPREQGQMELVDYAACQTAVRHGSSADMGDTMVD
jgi:hypothetical protein